MGSSKILGGDNLIIVMSWIRQADGVAILVRQSSSVVDTEPQRGGANSTRGQARRKTEFF